MKRDQYKAHAVAVLRAHHAHHATESLEDEAPAEPLSMASPRTEHAPPAVIVLRPSWLDLPARRLIRRITLLGICSIPAAIILTVVIHATWRLS
jgi:hypothetical protein